MSKPIKATQKMIEDILAEVRKDLLAGKFQKGKISISKEYKYPDGDKAKIIFSDVAWDKVRALVDEFSTEVGWHGTAFREEPGVYHIEDIMVYPQTVTGSTVTPDEKEYTNWMNMLDDDRFNNCRFHGHSHVNMGTSPSSVDTGFQEKILSQLDEDMFYIFMIFNKKGDMYRIIYDLATNTCYEGNEIEVIHYKPDLNGFLDESKSLVKTYSYKSPATPVKSSYSNSAPTVTPAKTSTKKEQSFYGYTNSTSPASYYDDYYIDDLYYDDGDFIDDYKVKELREILSFEDYASMIHAFDLSDYENMTIGELRFYMDKTDYSQLKNELEIIFEG